MKENNQDQLISTKNSDKSSKIILLIICIIGFLTLAVGLLAMGNLNGNGSKVKLRKLKGTSQQIIHRAILNTQDKLAKEKILLEEKSGSKALEDLFKSEATDMSFNVKVKGLSGMENESIINAVVKDLNLQGNLASTKDGQYWNAGLKVKQGELELANATLYKANQEFGIDSPKILGNPYAIKGDTFFEDLQNSSLYVLAGGQSGDEAQIQDFKEIVTGISRFKDIFNLPGNREYTDKSNRLYEYTIKELDIRKLNEQEKDYDIYEFALTSEQIANFNEKQMAIIMELDFAEDLFNLLAKYSGVTKEEFIEKIATDSTYGDVTVKFELHIDQYFIRSGICTIINNTYDEEMLSISFDLSGKDYLLSKGQWEVRAGEGFQVKVVFSNNLGEESNRLEKDLKINLTSYGETGFVSYKTSYDSKAKDNNYTVNFEATFPYIGAAIIEGEGTKVVSDEEVSTIIDELTCKITDDDTNEMQAKLALEYGVKAIQSKEAIFKSKEQAKYVLELSEEELTTMFQKIQNNLGAIGIALLQ